MSTQPQINGSNQIVLYKAEDGTMQMDVRLQDETIWVNLNQMAELFQRDKSVISRHIKSVFTSQELSQSVVANFATTAADGKTYQIDFYNLDMIISVGYRVNSKRGTQFRIWATNVLRKHLIEGYTFHTLEEKAAHLLYFVIKDHPLVDGNKRIAVLLFLTFLQRNNVRFHHRGLSDHTLVALALLIAESNPKEKEVLIRLVLHFLVS